MNLPSFVSVGRGTYWADLICHRWGNETISIGSYTSIAQQVKLLAGGGHRRDTVSTFPFDVLMRGAKTASEQDRCYEHGNGIEIGSDVHLGFGCTVIGSVKIGHGAVIAAGAVVFNDVPPYGICAGNPGRVNKFRHGEATVEALLRIAWWDWSEQEICERVDDFYLPIRKFVAKYDPWERVPISEQAEASCLI
jgi:acetyltransferase-like isoleucine patch superfamily enzyme